MVLQTLTELYQERMHLVEAQFATCESAEAAAACASACLGALRDAYAAACDDDALRRQAGDILVICQSACGLIAAISDAEVSLRLPSPGAKNPRARTVLRSARRYLPAVLCAALAAYLFLRNEIPAAVIAAVSAASCLLLPAVKAPTQALPEAKAVPRPDPKEMARRLERLVRDADALLAGRDAPEAGAPLLSAPLMESIQMLCEASLTGDGAFALRAASPLVAALEAQGLELMLYSPENAGWFDLIPGAGAGRTIRPALVRDGQLLARGQAIEPMR